MATTLARLPSYRWPRWVALLLWIAYLLYAFKQYEDLHRLNQHELALEGREIAIVVRNAIETVNKASDICRFDADQPYLELDSPKGCAAFNGGETDKDAQLLVDGGLVITTKVTVGGTARFRVLLETILAELAFPESFRLVFVANSTGEIIYQEAPQSRRWRRGLSWHEQNFRERTPDEGEGVAITNLGQLFADDDKPTFAQLTAGGSRFGISLGGQWEEVYLQPVAVAGTELVIGGLVPKTGLLRRAFQVETYAITLLVFLFFLGLFGSPSIKLYSLDRRERFRLLDAFLLYLGSGAVLVLSVFSVLALDGFVRFSSAADRGLVDLNEQLAGRFAKETSRAVELLADYDRRARVSLLPDCGQSKTPAVDWLDAAKAPPLEPPDETRAVAAEQVAWVGPDGMQVYKLTSDPAGRNQLVRVRSYFQAVRQKSLFKGPEGPPFFIGPARSLTDGKFYTFLSIQSRCRQGGELVAVLTTHIISLDRQPLPAGYGFALINREGAVLYHSDRRLSLRQNLYAELGDSSGLKSLVMAGAKGHVTTSYRERDHSLYAQPFTGFVPDGPARPSHLFLITFRDTSAEVATVAYVFMSSIVLLFVLVAAWMAAAIVVEVSSRLHGATRSGTWLWPRKSLDRFYRWQTYLLGGWLAFALFVSISGHGDSVFLAGPIPAVLIGVFNYRFLHEKHAGRERSEDSWFRAAHWALLTIIVAIGPAIAIFRLTLSHEFGKLVETERAWIEQQKLDVAQAVRKETRDEERPDREGRKIVNIRGRHYQVAAPMPFHEKAERIGEGFLRGVIEWAEHRGDWLPILTETGVRLREQEFDALYRPPGWIRWWALLLLALLSALALWWIHWSSDHLFLADLDTPEPAAEATGATDWDKAWNELNDEQQNLLLQVSRDHMSNPWQAEAVKDLVRRGFLQLNPGLEPRTGELAEFLKKRAGDDTMRDRMHDWEQVNAGHSWRYVRRLLVGALIVIALFVLATQPGLQSGLSAGAGILAAILTAVTNLKDALSGILPKKKETVVVPSPQR